MVPAVLARFLSILNTLDRFSKNTQLSNFTQIRSVGAEMFHAEGGETDTTEVTVAFRNFRNPPKMNGAKLLLPLCAFMVWPRDKCTST
jgi:hypothetical protein